LEALRISGSFGCPKKNFVAYIKRFFGVNKKRNFTRVMTKKGIDQSATKKGKMKHSQTKKGSRNGHLEKEISRLCLQ